jgi:threonylcarbamoyladenosine tRNA methylthiotransferase MtaB
LDEEFFALWEDPRLCRHLHLPLQSGCEQTLRRMARKTTPRSFFRLVAAARSAIPEIAITTDIIAGFPGETESEFERSLAFVEKMDFAGGHVFTYSARPGTAAAKMPNQVPYPMRKARNNRLRSVLEQSSRRYQQRFVGQTLPVLWEGATNISQGNWQLSGLTDNYLRVHSRDARQLWNQITPVRITQSNGDGLKGDLSIFQ